MKRRFYKLTLKVLMDDDGNEMNYYDFHVKDDEDLEWPWGHGVVLKDPPSKPLQLAVDLDDESAGDFADYVSGPIPMVTERFRTVLDAAGCNIEYFPVSIEGADRFDEFPTYFAANIVDKLAAADPKRSKFTEAFGGPGATLFDKLVLDPKLDTKLPLFILAENLSTLIVSEALKTKVEAAGVDTLHFIEV
jgi:hypothetical protein